MAESKIVQIRKKGGLNKILKTKQGGTINPVLYKSKSKNRNEEGTIEGDYRGRTILDTKHFISPIWDDLKKQWSFKGTDQDIARLIKGMKLRYPSGHKREGDLIEADNVAARLVNIKDEVFCHPDLYGRYYMENGRVSLNLSDPAQEFLFRCYQGNSVTDDKSTDGPVNKFIAAGTKYEIVSPRKENQKAKKDADKEIKAITLLAAMGNNEERMRAVARIMQLPQYNESTDSAGLFVLLKDMAAQNDSQSAKYRKTYQDRFIELSEMTDDELNVISNVIRGDRGGWLRKRQGYYLFNGEKLDGLDNQQQLIRFFQDPKNQDRYVELLDLLDNGGKQ